MFWNNKEFFRSVKFKTAASYAVLLALSLAVSFLIIIIAWRLGSFSLLDRELSGYVDRISYEYLTGRAYPEEFGSANSSVIKNARRLILKKYPDFKPVLTLSPKKHLDQWRCIGTIKNQIVILDSSKQVSEGFTLTPLTMDKNRELLSDELTDPVSRSGRRLNYFFIYDPADKKLSGSGISASEEQEFKKIKYKRSFSYRFTTIQFERNRIRLSYRNLPDGCVVAAGRNLHDLDSYNERLVVILLLSGVGIFILSAIVGWLIARRLCRSVEAVSKAAEAIAAGDYSLRVPPKSSATEIARMMNNFNTMIGNTENLMNELRTISDNIAHDLRTPLTRMLGRSEMAVTGPQDIDCYLDTLGENAEECRRMLSLINTMLDISRTASGAAELKYEEFDIALLLRQAAELFEMAASQNEQTLNCEITDEAVFMQGDRMRIQQVVANLLDNALKFTPAGGTISIKLRADEDFICFAVSDTGCGMSPEVAAQVFDRFFRADSSRNLPGNGLGLSLVQALITAHNGRIELTSKVGQGSVFEVILPRRKM